VFNAVLVEASGLGEVLFCGQGAGRMPTASAVMSDIIDIVAKNAPQNEPWSSVEKPEASAFDEIKSFAVRAKTTAEDIKALIPDAVIMSESDNAVNFAVKGISSRALDSLLSKTAVLAVLDLFD
jgi:homoserine dehydrogenase